jgi:hypothetical protein
MSRLMALLVAFDGTARHVCRGFFVAVPTAPASPSNNQARTNSIAIEDMIGGTFTISNGGVFGSMMGTPIINLPQVRGCPRD